MRTWSNSILAQRCRLVSESSYPPIVSNHPFSLLILLLTITVTMTDAVAAGITVRDVAADKFIAAYAEVLKNNDKFLVPKWVDLVKTGAHKELAPYDPDWYYVRAAAIVRKIYLRQGTGVGALKKRFGGCYRRGAAPERHQDAAGGLIRTICLSLDELNITEAHGKGGRKVTRTGQQALDLVAGQVAREEV
jgi:small subunit ribosomal protein S19e